MSRVVKFLIEGRMNMLTIEKWTICKIFSSWKSVVEIFYGEVENISRYIVLNSNNNNKVYLHDTIRQMLCIMVLIQGVGFVTKN